MGRYGDVSQESLRANWRQRQNSQKRGKSPASTSENPPHTAENPLKSKRPHNVHRLFPQNTSTEQQTPPLRAAQSAPDAQVDGGQGTPTDDEGTDRGPHGEVHAPTPATSPHAAPTPAPVTSPDWTEHPITKALEGFNLGLFGANPAQIIADSLNTPFARAHYPVPPTSPTVNPPFITPDVAPDVAPDVYEQPEQADIQNEMPIRPLDPDAPEFIEQDTETHGEGAAYEAFWSVWLGHQDYLRGQCIRMMSGNMADAEDALSNAMLRASQKFEAYSDSIVNERAWLSKLVYNVCIDHFRREQRTESRPFDQEQGMQVVDTLYNDPQQSPEEIALCQEQLDQLHQSMSQLSNNLRVPLFLRCVEGWTYPEIAERLNLRTDTVRKRIQLARDQLRRAGIR